MVREKGVAQRALASLGIAFVPLAWPCLSLVQDQSIIRYHSVKSYAPLVFGILLDLLILTLVIFLAVTWVRHFPVWRWIQAPLAVWLPFLLIHQILFIAGIPAPRIISKLLLTAAIAGMLWICYSRRKLFSDLMRLGTVVLAFWGISSILVFGQMLRIGLWRPAPPLHVAAASLPVHDANHPRIVWIVFDELSYDQTFEHRLAGLKLPTFDALRNQSVVYTDAQPIDDRTERVFLMLLLGRYIHNIRYTWGNRLYVSYPEEPVWVLFPAAQTSFAFAKQHGWNTGVVGWYNPYCSLMAPYLDDCFWTNENKGGDKPAWNPPPGQTAWSVAVAGLGVLAGIRKDRDLMLNTQAWQSDHAATFRTLFSHSLSLARDNRIDYMLLHLPVPHFPGIYDRRTGQFAHGPSSYADNLTLADRSLGELLAILEASPRWKNTTLIVCGDHSWRASWWQPYPEWTAEDQRMSHGGKFDPRPALLVHYPGQTSSVVNPEAVSLMDVHRIIIDTIRGADPSIVPIPGTTPASDAASGPSRKDFRKPR